MASIANPLPPALSVIIPCYNQGHFLHDALKSLSIVKEPLQIIVVNDGSTSEETIRLINALDQSKYKVIHQHNQGLAMARNNGIALASSPYILPMDADNYIDPELIEKALQTFTDYPETDIVYTDHVAFGSVNEIRNVGEFNLHKLLVDNYIDALAIYRKEVWEKNNGYDKDMPVMGWEDWEFWINSYKNGFRFHYLNKPLFYYRVADNSMLRSTAREEVMKKVRQYIFQKHNTLYQSFDLFLEITDSLRKLNSEARFTSSYIQHLEKNQLTPSSIWRKIKSKLT